MSAAPALGLAPLYVWIESIRGYGVFRGAEAADCLFRVALWSWNMADSGLPLDRVERAAWDSLGDQAMCAVTALRYWWAYSDRQ